MTEQEQLLTSVLGCERIELYFDPKVLSEDQQQSYDSMCKRLLDGEPLQYIIGHCDFMGCKLLVNENVLIPRPETEILVAHAIKTMNKYFTHKFLRILDLGAGSGSISIALAKLLSNCEVTSVDVSAEAISLAKENAEINSVNSKINFICEDMFDHLEKAQKAGLKFDLIISNPPYIKTSSLKDLPRNVKREPMLALDGKDDGLYFYKNIISKVKNLISDDGYLMMEIGDDQCEDVKELLRTQLHSNNITSEKDYVNTDRIIIWKN